MVLTCWRSMLQVLLLPAIIIHHAASPPFKPQYIFHPGISLLFAVYFLNLHLSCVMLIRTGHI